MKVQNNQSPSLITMLFLTWFYTGKFPKAPGTIGSLATLPLIYLMHYLGINFIGLISIIIGLYVLAIVVTEHIQKKYQLHDPGWIVIDEVIGMLVTWAFIMSVEFNHLFLVFALFRFFDIIKIWPASYFDRMHHGLGTITDDVVSGIFAGILVKLITYYI